MVVAPSKLPENDMICPFPSAAGEPRKRTVQHLLTDADSR